MERWVWLIRYGIAAFFALILASILGHSTLFQRAPLGPSGLTAGHLVLFFGYTAALALLWVAAVRAARELRDDGGWQSVARRTVMPLAALIILAIAYPVPLLLLGPFLHGAAMALYQWLFVVAITAAAVWLAVTVYTTVDVLMPLLSRVARSVAHGASQSRPTRVRARCDECGSEAAPLVTYCSDCRERILTAPCPHCGKALAA
jgi:hypothetical protein